MARRSEDYVRLTAREAARWRALTLRNVAAARRGLAGALARGRGVEAARETLHYHQALAAQAARAVDESEEE